MRSCEIVNVDKTVKTSKQCSANTNLLAFNFIKQGGVQHSCDRDLRLFNSFQRALKLK